MAPAAPKRAAFQKDNCADARAIIIGKMLNIKDHAGLLLIAHTGLSFVEIPGDDFLMVRLFHLRWKRP